MENKFFENIENIKLHYERITPMIMSRKSPGHWVAPYTQKVDFAALFTPIEMETWHALRVFGHAPLYPQYPAGKYFLDFGNPAVKVGIECDGKEFHKDKDRDNRRDEELSNDGWRIFRIPGRDCMVEVKEDETGDMSTHHNFYRSIEGLIKSLAVFYFGYTGGDFESEIGDQHQCLLKYCSPAQLIERETELNEIMERLCKKYYGTDNEFELGA